MESFYVDLISNASLNVFTDNSISKFSNLLEKPIEVSGEYEVAITELFYPMNIQPNVKTVSFRLIDEIDLYSLDPIDYPSNEIAISIQENDDIATVIGRLNDSFSSKAKQVWPSSSPPQFAKKPGSDKNILVMGQYSSPDVATGKNVKRRIIPICLDYGFFEYLGFSNKEVKKALKNIEATRQPFLDIKSHLVLIYTDIIVDHNVGDTSSSLLRVTPLTSGNFKDIAHCTFANPNYYALRRKRIESISILLCDEYGNQIQFKSGCVHLTLHFRKVYKPLHQLKSL